ncbi:hypothetical protein C9890_0070 [Perkinsus sp. BL_2016]|nr:hypothetical protein C9890_0070 [Perkinsus sp. BL_2016]
MKLRSVWAPVDSILFYRLGQVHTPPSGTTPSRTPPSRTPPSRTPPSRTPP